MKYAIDEIYTLISKGDWGKNDFAQVSPPALPSYVSALFSELAYYHIPQWEIDDKKRVKLIPCLAYQELAAMGVASLAPTIDAGRFVIEDRGIIVLGTLINRVLFIAFRGTQFLYDWAINKRARLVPVQTPWWYEEWICGQVHSGFLEEAIRVSAKILYELRNLSFEHVFLTGHSLGGAVASLSEKFLRRRIGNASIYIFGSPKYCDVSFYATRPFGQLGTQFRRIGDLVPTIPPFPGYADHPYEFATNCSPYIDASPYAGNLKEAASWKTLKAWYQFWADDFEAHSIESYRRELGLTAKAAGASLPLSELPKLTKADIV